MGKTTTGEAAPSQNTAQAPKFNPITFNESALAKLLEGHLAEPQVEQKPETPSVNAEEEKPEVNQDTETKPDVTDETSSDEAPSQSEDSETTEDTEPEKPEETSGVQKRIDKLVAQKKEAAERAEALDREVNELREKLKVIEERPPVEVLNGSTNPFSNVWEIQTLDKEWENARQAKRWAEDNAEGAVVDGKEFSADHVKQIRRRAEDALEVHIPSRARFLQQHQQVKPLAEKVYPFWKDRSSKDYTEAQAILRQMPQLGSHPEYQILIGDFLEGRRVRLERQAAPKVAPKPAPKQPSTPKASPSRVSDGEVKKQAAKQSFARTGSETDLARVLEGMI